MKAGCYIRRARRDSCVIIQWCALCSGIKFLSPNLRTLPGDPAGFAFSAQLLVGPADGPGEESFELTVCSPEWLAVRCRSGKPVNGLNHVIVGWDTYDERVLRDWLEARVHAVEAATWDGLVSHFRLLGGWEFEGYRP